MEACRDQLRAWPYASFRRARWRWMASGCVARARGAERQAELLTAGYWADVIAEAESGLLDFVTIEDGLGLQSSGRSGPDSRTDQVRGQLDAVLIAAGWRR